ncbi:unnamed protein product [Rotaria magnacalcarata]|uniref:Uncharacterized protein n=2 Tax=Rotaria magnacalcarata TaxID=392030 RepID=A0A819I2E3_9BILA|nr:unnamed protein product [Rotaria magnacalcarata]CAF3906285.1 unnamed protein product [Rotaria magnacalcarata]
MATVTYNDESFVERDEVVYPSSDVIDAEPYYNNFTAIQKAVRYDYEQKQSHVTNLHRSHSTDNQYRAIRTLVEPSSLRHAESNEILDMNTQHRSKSTIIPIKIESKRVDGHIFNLTKIMEDIGYNRDTPFIRSSSDSNSKNVSALLNIVLKMGGANGPLVNVWRSRIDNDYFQRWYLEKHRQRSASLIQHNTINTVNKNRTQYSQNRDSQSNLVIDHFAAKTLPTQTMINENYYENASRRIYGFDETDTISTASTPSTLNEIELDSNFNSNQNRPPPLLTTILKKPDTYSNQNSQTKHVAIRTNSPTNQSVSSQQINHKSNQNVLSDYQQFIQNHPDVHNDPNPQIIVKQNPDQVTYQQNVSVRYLVPPTPPPPGPLIIREIAPPRLPTPPPVIIKYQEPSPPTPPPLILREAPPPPPPKQETTVITRMLPQEPQPPRRVIIEKHPPLPPKPQPVIIEKWLPYKPAPPQEVIHERVVQNPSVSQYQTDAAYTEQKQQQHHHQAEFHTNTYQVQMTANRQQQRSSQNSQQEYIIEQQAPPEDLIYQRIVENPLLPQYQTSAAYAEQQERQHHQTEFHKNATHVQTAANRQQQNSSQNLQQEYTIEQQAPPEDLIYQRIVENPLFPQYQTSVAYTEQQQKQQQQQRHSAEFHKNATRVQTAANRQQQNSGQNLQQEYIIEQQAPQQDLMYECIDGKPLFPQYQTDAAHGERQRRHSAEFHTSESHVRMGTNMQRRNSSDHLVQDYIVQQPPSGLLDQLTWKAHQQMLAMQQQGRKQLQAQQQWAANLWQQHANMYSQYPMQLTAPSMLVYHQPISMHTASYAERQEYQQQVQYNQTYAYPFM